MFRILFEIMPNKWIENACNFRGVTRVKNEQTTTITATQTPLEKREKQ